MSQAEAIEEAKRWLLTLRPVPFPLLRGPVPERVTAFTNWFLVAGPTLVKAAEGKQHAKLLEACKLFKQWMRGGQPGPFSDNAILEIVEKAIDEAEKADREQEAV